MLPSSDPDATKVSFESNPLSMRYFLFKCPLKLEKQKGSVIQKKIRKYIAYSASTFPLVLSNSFKLLFRQLMSRHWSSFVNFKYVKGTRIKKNKRYSERCIIKLNII